MIHGEPTVFLQLLDMLLNFFLVLFYLLKDHFWNVAQILERKEYLSLHIVHFLLSTISLIQYWKIIRRHLFRLHTCYICQTNAYLELFSFDCNKLAEELRMEIGDQHCLNIVHVILLIIFKVCNLVLVVFPLFLHT